MKTTLKENVLTVVTEIAKEDFDKKVTDMTVEDDKGHVVFELRTGKEPVISKYALVCNSTVDGKLAVTMTVPMDTEAEEVKVKYGKALLAAEEHVKTLADRIAADTKAIDKLFAADK